MAPSSASPEEIRRRSKALFRNAYVLEVSAAITAGKRFTLTSLLGDSGLSPSLYSGPLRRLVELGLIADDPQPADDHRERWYRAVKSPLWATARALAK